MQKIDFLDGVRGLAILLVLIFHLLFMVLPTDNMPTFWLNAGRFLMHGVTLFFVLSGFLIGSILLHNKNSKSYFKTFYIKRIGRIIPIYYLLILGYYIFKYILFPDYEGHELNSGIPDWAYPFFAQSFFIPRYGLGPGIMNVTWSLCVEEQFYLFAPLFIFLFDSSKLVILCISGILLSLFSRLLLPGFENLGILALITSRADSLFMGILLAVAYRNKELLLKIKDNQASITVLLGILTVGIILQFLGFAMGVFQLTWIAMFFAIILLIPLANNASLPCKFFNQGFLKFFGKYSYGLYIYHMPLNYLLKHLNSQYGVSLDTLNHMLIFNSFSILIILIFSYFSYEYFEKRIINYVNRFKYN
jgi:peptidoglycan/LPS O-acetylase OafA/YrhL